MVLPIPNPTGNPYDRPNLAKINDESELKGLQVKAELEILSWTNWEHPLVASVNISYLNLVAQLKMKVKPWRTVLYSVRSRCPSATDLLALNVLDPQFTLSQSSLLTSSKLLNKMRKNQQVTKIRPAITTLSNKRDSRVLTTLAEVEVSRRSSKHETTTIKMIALSTKLLGNRTDIANDSS